MVQNDSPKGPKGLSSRIRALSARKTFLSKPCPYCAAGARNLWDSHSEPVESLEEFVNTVAPMAPNSAGPQSGLYWFRGQTTVSWGLQPSFMRVTRNLTERLAEAIALEYAALHGVHVQGSPIRGSKSA